MPHVPKSTSRPQKDGTTFDYGGYDVTLVECTVCGGVYASEARLTHDATEGHKAKI